MSISPEDENTFDKLALVPGIDLANEIEDGGLLKPSLADIGLYANILDHWF